MVEKLDNKKKKEFICANITLEREKEEENNNLSFLIIHIK